MPACVSQTTFVHAAATEAVMAGHPASFASRIAAAYNPQVRGSLCKK
jgi:hypothetical protein